MTRLDELAKGWANHHGNLATDEVEELCDLQADELARLRAVIAKRDDDDEDRRIDAAFEGF